MGGAQSSYTEHISEVNVVDGCVTMFGSTALWHTMVIIQNLKTWCHCWNCRIAGLVRAIAYANRLRCCASFFHIVLLHNTSHSCTVVSKDERW